MPDNSRNQLAAAALLLSGSVVLSRLLGYARDAVIAGMLGASEETDAYYAAFGLPDLMLYFLAGGALSIAFVPIFTRKLAENREDEGWALYSNIATTGGIILAAALVIAFIFAEPAIRFLLPDFTDGQVARTVSLTRIILPGPFFFFIGGLTLATEMARKRFAAAAIAPLVYNLSIIVGGIALAPKVGAAGFSWGVLAGSILGPFLTSVLFARRTIRFRPRINLRSSDLHRYAAIALPLMIGVSLTTIDEWYGRYFASGMTEGTITWLNNARRLMLVPIALVGQAIGQAALPFLSRLAADGDRKTLESELGATVQATLVLSSVAAVGLALIAFPATRLVYGHGAYTADDVARTARLLTFFCLAVPAWSAQAVIMRGFYAQEDTWRPMLATTFVALASFFAYATLSNRWDATGLAIACAIGISSQAVASTLLLWKAHGVALGSHLLRGLGIAAFATIPGAVAVISLENWVIADASTAAGALFAILWRGLLFGIPAILVVARFGGRSGDAIARRLPGPVRRIVFGKEKPAP